MSGPWKHAKWENPPNTPEKTWDCLVIKEHTCNLSCSQEAETRGLRVQGPPSNVLNQIKRLKEAMVPFVCYVESRQIHRDRSGSRWIAEDVGDADKWGVAANWYWVSLGGDKNIFELYGIMCIQIWSYDKPILKEWVLYHVSRMPIKILLSWRKEYPMYVFWVRNKWDDTPEGVSPQPGRNIKEAVGAYTTLTLWQAVFPDRYPSVHLILSTEALNRHCSSAIFWMKIWRPVKSVICLKSYNQFISKDGLWPQLPEPELLLGHSPVQVIWSWRLRS